MLWKEPRRGNAYYILAHQYIAAVLNGLTGADTTAAMDDVLSNVETFFNMYTLSDKLSKSDRDQAITWATTLDQYNNGVIGPGHCSE